MKKPLVSIIIPCYNVEFLIFRLLDSILLQNYSNVEVIAIDDGSTDHTSQVLQSYVDKFKDKKYDFHIYEQINQGLSTTINNGLKYVRGEYLLWPDADDWFDDDTTITSMVYVLNNHPEYSCVRVMANYVDEITMTKTPIAIQNKSKEDLFEDFYYWNNNIWAPAGSHMIRTAKLFSELTDRSIFTNKDGGQNYQLLLPVPVSYTHLTLPTKRIV